MGNSLFFDLSGSCGALYAIYLLGARITAIDSEKACQVFFSKIL
jgi:hypothetical protein